MACEQAELTAPAPLINARMRCFFAQVLPALTKEDVQCCMAHLLACRWQRWQGGGQDGHLELHLCGRVQYHWALKIRFLASSRSLKSLSYSKVLKRTVSSLSTAAEMKPQAVHSDQNRSADKLSNRGRNWPCCNLCVEADAVYRFNPRILPQIARLALQLLMLGVGRAGRRRPPAAAGFWILEDGRWKHLSPCDITTSSPPPDSTMAARQ